MPRFKLKRRKAVKPRKRAVQALDWGALWTELFDRLSGGESVAEICSDHEDWPAARKLHRAISADPELSEHYNQARRAAVMSLSEEILPIADDARNDFMTRETARGNVVTQFDSEAVQRSRLRIDARFKILEAFDPERFGKKLDLSNKDGSFAQAWAQALGVVSEEKHATKH